MNSTTAQLTKGITSLALAEFLEQGGEVIRLETIHDDRGPDWTIHVLELQDREGTIILTSGEPGWYDADFDRTVEAIRNRNTEDLGTCYAVAAL